MSELWMFISMQIARRIFYAIFYTMNISFSTQQRIIIGAYYIDILVVDARAFHCNQVTPEDALLVR